jgi:hypothetical protein
MGWDPVQAYTERLCADYGVHGDTHAWFVRVLVDRLVFAPLHSVLFAKV